MLDFEDVALSRKSEVWQNFTYCKLCQAILKVAGSSTKGLIMCLKPQHKIAVMNNVVMNCSHE